MLEETSLVNGLCNLSLVSVDLRILLLAHVSSKFQFLFY